VAVSADVGPLARNQRDRRLRGLVARGAHDPEHDAIGPLLRAHRSAHPRADLAMLRHAYEVAERMHRGQLRRSGEPFITHPLAVASILAELGVDTTTLVAALLHDTVEDTVYTLEQARAEFGDEVAQRIARVTLDVLVPLADRLGIQVFKRELEDLAFATLEPEAYQATTALLRERAARAEAELRVVAAAIDPALRSSGVKAAIGARPKHVFSVHHTLLERGGGDLDVYDVARLLIVVNGDAPSCYVAMGALHGCWKPVLGRFKDFIAMPKFNLYQSLHTTVIGPGDRLIQVLIRTEEMHRAAEHGVVSRLRDRAGRSGALALGPSEDLEWLRRLVDWQQDAPDPGEFLESLRHDLSDREIVAFSPKGAAISLPQGATPVDFAYAVGTDTGHRCVGARVNGQLVSLGNPLSDGDVVEILTTTSEDTGPSRDWLEFVKTPQAQLKVRQWFTDQRRGLAIDAGRRAVAWALHDAGRHLDTSLADGSLARAAAELRYATLEDLFQAVGETLASPAWVVQQLLSAPDAPAPSEQGAE
jgi:guanosine-3',5'-bis(diphosphate) 3'-pyrophosphohydrolase